MCFFMKKVEIGKRVKEFIEFKKWKKIDFAKNVNIFPQDVNKYLTGVQDIQRLFISLYEAGCSIDWLISGKGSMLLEVEVEVEKVNSFVTNDVEKRLNIIEERMNKLDEVEAMLKMLVKQDIDNKKTSSLRASRATAGKESFCV